MSLWLFNVSVDVIAKELNGKVMRKFTGLKMCGEVPSGCKSDYIRGT